ncbi:hypothetical protein BDV41DRAFT_540875 [Aspergillus transmontanensis]|uniref:Uncharacterized protein n=1 Tax=Aspergillus transmontanensis TaxID=1034304 RepID=A0A5N6VTY5_9EURO|nr:hypothetical protein BDV41DRAFT_540875 [Aspergillus transmontanensis]
MKFSTDLVGFDRTVHVFDSRYSLMSFFLLCLLSILLFSFFSNPNMQSVLVHRYICMHAIGKPHSPPIKCLLYHFSLISGTWPNTKR